MKLLLHLITVFCFMMTFTASSSSLQFQREWTFETNLDSRVGPGAVTFDPSSNSIFVATLSQPSTIVKYSVASTGKVAVAAATTLRENEDSAHALLLVDGLLWVALSTPKHLPAHLAVLDSGDLSREDGVTLGSNENKTITSLMSVSLPSHQNGKMEKRIFVGLASSPARISEIVPHFHPFGGGHRGRSLLLDEYSTVLALASSEAAGEEGFIFVSVRSPPAVLKIDIRGNNLTLADSLLLAPNEVPSSMIANEFFIFVASGGTHARVFRITASDRLDRVKIGRGEDSKNEAVHFGNEAGTARWWYRLAHLDDNVLFLTSEDDRTSLFAVSHNLKKTVSSEPFRFDAGERLAGTVKMSAGGQIIAVTASVPPKLLCIAFRHHSDESNGEDL